MEKLKTLHSTDHDRQQELWKDTDNQHFFVSHVKLPWFVAEPPEYGYETMIFYCDSEGCVTDWLELYCNRYTNFTPNSIQEDVINWGME
jgi:hypothetical protein